MKKEVQIDRELIKNGLMRETRTNSRTNPHTIPIHTEQLFVHLRTNYSLLFKAIPGDLMRQVLTIHSRSEEATRIVNYIIDNPSFLVPTLRHKLGIKNRTIYQIINDLWPWVKKTDKTITHPGRGPGNPPHVWTILDDLNEELFIEGINEARKSYYEILELTNSKIKRLEAQKRQLNEALAIAKDYMEKRDLKIIPDRIIIAPILKKRGINVNYHNLINLLSKEGYKWK